MTLCLNHRNTRITLVWSPEDISLEGRTLAQGLAAEACRRGHHRDLNRVHSAAYQKDRARQITFINWGSEWLIQHTQRGYLERSWWPSDFGEQTWVRTHPLPKGTPSFTYANTLTRPLDGGNHPLCGFGERLQQGRNRVPRWGGPTRKSESAKVQITTIPTSLPGWLTVVLSNE